eukprot:CAMPEP_0204198504 /NCGR_PEP_ID=MMETSP0361-20130328/65331_1 /ASSEMBLY_ACC=CAM_ASM_000343 /TAXON_ID=268821 /ORGANISM="Scrippsiella Hangoei, Strain SHTV-5" /LENGTH=127 /DNA_ID=CAMNT_0051160627 /DNA_START=55 /DNA_END=438 /DNA_ORIENTATION=-
MCRHLNPRATKIQPLQASKTVLTLLSKAGNAYVCRHLRIKNHSPSHLLSYVLEVSANPVSAIPCQEEAAWLIPHMPWQALSLWQVFCVGCHMNDSILLSPSGNMVQVHALRKQVHDLALESGKPWQC